MVSMLIEQTTSEAKPKMGCCRFSPHSGICGFCVKAFKWLPVIVISAIVVWSYYAYVVHLCILTIDSEPVRYILIFIFHVLFILFLWSYWRTVWSQPGKVPLRFRLTGEELDRLEGSENDLDQRRVLDQVVITRDLPVTMRTLQGCVRYCDRCTQIKPDRAHHCSVCGDCVLKMDHHCPWVNNCVAFNNYKFFFLFLLYGFVYCIFIAFSVLKYFLQFWSRSLDSPGQSKFHILFLFFVSSMFSISLCSLLGYHIHLLLNNRTTLEAFRAPVFSRGLDKEGFSLGKLANIQEVFGDNWKVFLLPVFSSFGDGLTFPQRFVDEERGGGGGGPRNQERWEVEEERVPMLSREEEEEERLAVASCSDSEEEEEVLLVPPNFHITVQS